MNKLSTWFAGLSEKNWHMAINPFGGGTSYSIPQKGDQEGDFANVMQSMYVIGADLGNVLTEELAQHGKAYKGTYKF